jgi:pyruvate formate lyase activating enzyme
VKCGICPHGCELEEGQTGFCMARKNIAGEIKSVNYGEITSLALDPIEKKPLNRFFSGSLILSAGSFGCNLRCGFCQNHEISMALSDGIQTAHIPPDELISKALELKANGNIGIAYTYNEPLIGYEYVNDCSVLAHKNGLKNVLVTNGYICEKPLSDLLPYIDAMNIDLKGFSEEFYKRIRGGLETVKKTIELAYKRCHVEVTTLIIPDENDGEDEIRGLSEWLSGVGKDIPLHISRFFPRYKYKDRAATRIETVHRLAGIARESLDYVYAGNC